MDEVRELTGSERQADAWTRDRCCLMPGTVPRQPAGAEGARLRPSSKFLPSD